MSASNRNSVNLAARPHAARPTPAKRGRWLTSSALGAAILAATSSAALAQELPGTVNSTVGTVAFGAIANNQQTITQTGQRAVINWNDFNVAGGQTLTFSQPNASAIVLNRVQGTGQSAIDGTISANGRVWLLNPNGVMVGNSGNINVGGFLGSTHAMITSDNDFLNSAINSFAFGNAATTEATVTNNGRITATNGGYAILAGRLINNGDGTLGNGVVTANLGTVVLGGVPSFTIGLDDQNGSLLSFLVGSGEYSGLPATPVNHRGEINAIGGKVIMTARAANDIIGSVINVGGVVNATTAIRDESGNVTLAGVNPGGISIDGGANGIVKIADEAGGIGGGLLNVNSDTAVAAGSISVTGKQVDIGTAGVAKLFASGIGPDAPASGSISITGNSITAGTSSQIQAMAFGGVGKTGGTVSIDASGAGSQVTIAGLVESGVAPDFRTGFMGQGGTNGIAGSIAVEGDSVTLAPGAPGGRLIANAGPAGGVGGLVQIAGNSILIGGSGLADNVAPSISAGGGSAAGTVMIGGGLGGSGILGRALPTGVTIGGDAAIYTEVFGTPGNGGTISIWSDLSGVEVSTTVHGRVSSRSALGGGNGGTIEIGGRNVQVLNNARIEAGADGNGGNIRLIGDAITVSTNVSVGQPLPVGIFAAGNGGNGGTISIGGGAGGSLLAGKPLARSVTIGNTSRMNVRAVGATGNSGRINIWSDPNNPESSTTLTGGQFVGENFNGGPAALFEIGGSHITLGKLEATAPGGSINFIVGDNGEIDTGYGYGSGTGYGEFTAGGSNVSFLAGNGADVTLAGLLATNGGAFVLNAGAGSVVENYGTINAFFDATGNSIAFNLGADSEFLNRGLITTGSNSIALTGGDGARITNFGTIDSNGGNITMSVGAAAFEPGRFGYGYYDGVFNFGDIYTGGGNLDISVGSFSAFSTYEASQYYNDYSDYFEGGLGFTSTAGGQFKLMGGDNSRAVIDQIITGGGDLSVTTGVGGSIVSGDYEGGFDTSGETGGGNATLTVGNGGYIDLFNDFTGGGSLTASAGAQSEIYLDNLTTNGGNISVTAGELSFIELYNIYSGVFDAAGGGNISVTGGNGADIYVGDLLSSNGGAISLAVGDSLPNPFGEPGFSESPRSNIGGIFIGQDINTGGGDLSLAGGAGTAIETAFFSSINTQGGDISVSLGGGNADPSNFKLAGGSIIDTSSSEGPGGSFTLTAGNASSSKIYGSLFTDGGNVVIGHGTNSSIVIGGSPDPCECNAGYVSAGLGDVDLSADQLSVDSNGFFTSQFSIFGDDIRLNADSVDIFGRVYGLNSVAIAPRTVNRAINIGGIENSSGALSLDELELDNMDAPTIVFGRADGTGAVSIALTDQMDDGYGYGYGYGEAPSTTIVQAGGIGGSITLAGIGTSDDLETIRLVAGSNITLAQGFQFVVDGKLELVSGGSFTNNAGANALSTTGDGQWLVYSANPAGDVFGGLLSGQNALWGRDFATVATNGLTHSGNIYAFGLAPTVTVAAVNRTKTYGDTIDLSVPIVGRDFTVTGIVNAAQFGGVFLQDSLSGVPTLASSGSAASANAGGYAIAAGAGAGLSAGNGYNLVFQGGSLTVDPRQLTAALIGSVQKVYDTTTGATLAAANYSLAGFVNGDGATVGQTSGSFASPNVGSNLTVTASLGATNFAANSGTSLSNYLLPTLASGAIGTITPATLTYVANPASRLENTANPAFSGNVTGLLGSDTIANATSGTLAFTTPAAIDSPAGSYAINGGGLIAGNYVFTQAPGNATALQVAAAPPPIPPAMQPAQQITTTVIQQVTNSSRTPPPTPTPPPALTPPPAPPTSSIVNTGPVAPPPPPPPPPPPTAAPINGPGGNAPPPPPTGPAVEATPPSPVGEQAPPTPSDSADQGDPVLAEASTPEEEQDEAPSEKRQLASTTVVVPGVNVEVPVQPRPPEVPGADQSFSGSGNPAQW